MDNQIFGGMPSYISAMFKKKPKAASTPAPAPKPASARDTPEAKAALNAQVDALFSEQGMAPEPKESTGSAIGRGLAGFLGFVPKGGTRGDAVDGFANIGRALLGENSVQQMESDYNDSIAPEKLRRALAEGDVEAIKRLDPKTAAEVQGVDETTYTDGRQRQFDEAVARGDVDAMRRLDPAAADLRDEARRGAALRAARAARQIGADNPEQGAAVLSRFAQEQPNLFSAQELQAFDEGGPDALEAMLTGESRSGKDRFLSVGGGIYDMDKEEWVEAQTREPTAKELAEIELIRARTSAVGRSNRGTGGTGAAATGTPATPEAKAGFTGSLNNIADTAVKLAGMGAIGVDGKGARTPFKSAIVGAKNKDGNRGFIGSIAALVGDDTAQLFNARETQVDFALRQFAAAAGIKSGSLNSNFELQNVKNALGDPFAPMEAQIAAADAMSLTYGDGTRTADYLLQSGKITQTQYADIASRTQGFTGNIERGVAAEQGGGATGGGGEEIVSVTTVEEAMALPPGTQFKTPDGRIKVR
jgi:hypothetical protein